MSMRSESVGNRREALLKSLETAESEGATTHLVNLMASAPGSRPAQCTITGYCRSFLFEFPHADLLESVDCRIVYSDGDFKAVIVSDLIDYFEREPDSSPHYRINVSFRAGVRSTYAKALEQADQQTDPNFPLFLVVEESRKLPPTVLNKDECFTMDEYRDGAELIKGGRFVRTRSLRRRNFS